MGGSLPTRDTGRLHFWNITPPRLTASIPTGEVYTVVASTDVDGAPEQATPDEVNSALDRLLIADAMTQLSPEHRAVVDRSYYRGWTTAQIAADLDIAEGTVKSRLHYAVRALRLTLQELGVTR